MAVYYNDADPAACGWLRELIATGLLPAGEVDGRSILHLEPADLRGFAQCHFFAGIGGWPYALRLAGVAGDLSVWTGSPPCQPFSQAGQRMREIMDRLSPGDPTQRVVFMKAAQVGAPLALDTPVPTPFG